LLRNHATHTKAKIIFALQIHHAKEDIQPSIIMSEGEHLEN